jgi:hypothetical protein
MKESRFRFKLATSLARRRKPVRISATTKDTHILNIQHYPDYSRFLFVFLVLAGWSVWLFILGEIPFLFYPTLFIIFFIHFFHTNRAITCIVDKSLEQIHYSREGIMGLHLNEKNIVCNISEIKQFEIKRYIRRNGYTYKIILLLNNGSKLPLSSGDLGMSECKRFMTKFFKFMGREIPVKGIESYD